MTPAQAKKRVRYLIAVEIRQRITEIPGHLVDEPDEVIRAWKRTAEEQADKVWPENRMPPGGRSTIDHSSALTGKDGTNG